MKKNSEKLERKYTIETLEYILDKLPYQIWIKDKDGRYIYVNEFGAEKIGVSKEDIIGKDDFDLREYDVAKKCIETDRVLLERKREIYNEEHSILDGEDVCYKVHKFIYDRDEINESILCGVAEEIGLNRSLQLKLENNLLNYLDEGKFEEDNKSYINNKLLHLKKSLKCKNIEILLYDEVEKFFKVYISENKDGSKFKESGGIYIDENIERKLYCNNILCDRYSEIHDKIIKLQANNVEDIIKIKHVNLAGKLFGLVCISYDKDVNIISIDDSFLDEIIKKISIIIKQIENKDMFSSINERKKELEAIIDVESIKTDFFANVSHEFRTPVNIIISIIQLLDLYSEDSDGSFGKNKYNEYLNILRQNSYRLLRLVNNIVDIAKISNDFYDIKLENYNIIRLVENIVMSTVGYANEKKRNIIFDTDEEEVILACDGEKIERVILNLISNAIKFSYINTDIEIKINTRVDLKKVFISIVNYGEIIKKNDRERIFSRFVQIDDLLNRKREGSGIGLFLAKKFVEMHGGEIYVEDVEDFTQITFYLPIEVIDEGYVGDESLDKNSAINKCDIEFSDIY